MGGSACDLNRVLADTLFAAISPDSQAAGLSGEQNLKGVFEEAALDLLPPRLADHFDVFSVDSDVVIVEHALAVLPTDDGVEGCVAAAVGLDHLGLEADETGQGDRGREQDRRHDCEDADGLSDHVALLSSVDSAFA